MRLTSSALVLGLTVALIPITASAGDPFLYAGDSFSGNLYRIDKTTGAATATVPVTLNGQPAAWIKGLAAEPGSGVLYAVVGESAPPEGVISFTLATIAPDTGVATKIGDLNRRFAGLAWVTLPPPDGVGPGPTSLVGITGFGDPTNPETLFIIDHTTATSSLLLPLNDGTPSETIAFNPVDGLLYHLSGRALGPNEGQTIVFESIDLGTLTVTQIPLGGTAFGKGNGLTFDDASGNFLFAVEGAPAEGFPGELYSLTTTGIAAVIGSTPAFYGGMAFSFQVPVELQSLSVE